MTDELGDFSAYQAAVLGTPVIVSSALPFQPSPGEDARRIVRHGFARLRTETGRACFYPDSLGEVGPAPGAPTEAMWLGDRVAVSAQLAEKLKAEAAVRADVEARNRLWKAVQDRRWRKITDGIRAAVNVGLGHSWGGPVTAVTSYKLDHRLDETLFRANLASELEEIHGAVFTMRDEEIRRHLSGGDAELVRVVANALLVGVRRHLAEIKVADEEAGRGR